MMDGRNRKRGNIDVESQKLIQMARHKTSIDGDARMEYQLGYVP